MASLDNENTRRGGAKVRGLICLSARVRYNMLTIGLERATYIPSSRCSKDSSIACIRIGLSSASGEGGEEEAVVHWTEAESKFCDPIFNEQVSVEVSSEEGERRRVCICLWHRDGRQLNSCEFVGAASFSLSQLSEHEVSGWQCLLLPDDDLVEDRRCFDQELKSALIGSAAPIHLRESHEVAIGWTGDEREDLFSFNSTVPTTVYETRCKAAKTTSPKDGGGMIVGTAIGGVSRHPSTDFVFRSVGSDRRANLRVQNGRDLDLSFARPFLRTKTRRLRRRISAALDRIGRRMGRGGWSPNGKKPSPLIGGKTAKPGR